MNFWQYSFYANYPLACYNMIIPHIVAGLMDFPVSMGGYEYTGTSDDRCMIQMTCPNTGSTWAGRLCANPWVQTISSVNKE